MVCKCGCPLFEGEIMCPDCLRPVEKSNIIELTNGSIIKPIKSDDSVRSKRGQGQLKFISDLINSYYKNKNKEDK
jgi:uncharacterized Zn finger protein (UPF0148 family)